MSSSASTSSNHGDGSHPQATVSEDAHTIMVNSVSWGAIFAGVVVGLVVQILLTMLGTGLGLATLSANAGNNPGAGAISATAGIWYIVSGIIASFCGGYVASRMSGRTVATTGAFHGLTAWAFSTLLVLYMLSTAVGGVVGGAFAGISNAMGGIADTVSQSAPVVANSTNPLESIDRQVRASGGDPEALNAAASNAIRSLVLRGEDGADEARAEAANALAAARGIPEDQARQQVAEIEANYRQAVDRTKQAAADAAQTASSVVSTGALIAFAALVLGAIAGWLGGRSGVVHPVIADRLAGPFRRRG